MPGLEQDGLELLQSMLAYEPSKRISASQALEHPFFANVPALMERQLGSYRVLFWSSGAIVAMPRGTGSGLFAFEWGALMGSTRAMWASHRSRGGAVQYPSPTAFSNINQ
eukprot:scaffold694_cov338-Pavlova_lutheri.AAC.45